MLADFRFAKLSLSALAIGCAVYCLVTLAYVATTPDVGLRCLIAEDDPAARTAGEVTVVSAPACEGKSDHCPLPGDRVIEFAGHRTRTFIDFARAVAWVRSAPDRPGIIGNLNPGTDPYVEVPPESTVPLLDHPEMGRLAKVRYRAGGQGDILRAWVPLRRQPIGGLALSLVWFVLHILMLALSGMAFWKRPYDRPLRAYFALCAVTVVAYVGGNHWWVISGSLGFTIPFAVCAMLVPAVLLHFFLVYPTPKGVVQTWPVGSLIAVYSIPGLFAAASVALMLAGNWLSQDVPATTDLARLSESLRGFEAAQILPALRHAIYVYMLVAAGYFVLSIIALVESYRSARNLLERSQVKWILWASLFAAVAVVYTLALAYFDRVGFAFGEARIPMVLASLSFTLAYAVGIATTSCCSSIRWSVAACCITSPATD